jgi:hypothetical protein
MKKRDVSDTVHGKVQAIHCISYQKLYSVKHNSVKRYWGVEVKFPLNEAHNMCGHAGIKKNPGHPTKLKIFVGSTFYVHANTLLSLLLEGGVERVLQ